eukprot:m.1231132 g.1231132  ORF g.1231132 m.1231132 type:complete len:60 (+) comp24657_c0_seq18:2026-2205(+)
MLPGDATQSAGVKRGVLSRGDLCLQSLRVRYRVFNQLHETTIDDEAELACPLSWHRIQE